MYIITENNQENSIEVKSASRGMYAKICLNDGGSLQELGLNNIPLIVDLAPLSYQTTYASAVLFPFANRIKDGQYCFNGESFQLDRNNKEENNALHGLVYDKPFKVIQQSAQTNSAEVIMSYDYKQLEAGFPFPFTIQLKYTFTQKQVDLNVSVINTSKDAFPFTIGWHPYFLSKNLDLSVIRFESERKLNIGNRNIGLDLEPIAPMESITLKDKSLDDCWKLKEDEVMFETPRYKLKLSSSKADNFLQLYTPPKKDIIAIEPTTGVSNSFNNNIGLGSLKPQEVYEITWTLNVYPN